MRRTLNMKDAESASFDYKPTSELIGLSRKLQREPGTRTYLRGHSKFAGPHSMHCFSKPVFTCNHSANYSASQSEYAQAGTGF